MRILTALAIAASMLGSVAHASHLSARQAKPLLVKAAMRSAKVVDKGGSFKSTLLGKAGDTVRGFRLSNVRTIGSKHSPGGHFGPRMLHIGGIATGTINLATHKVAIKGYSMVR